ncbi:hypothetical protein L0A91_05190 [Ornithinimicrobium sp. INDO-MA30-4]|nr:hypothetical protein [Ornithinimicrobium sp. INDO-MA30-4]UJH71712.1 hypothetical protein L0A91_05190 [Ornithinimicrobium sp. INDO-MA30-4]
MRVLAVTTWLPTKSHPSTGAFVVKDALALASLGHEVALIHLSPPEQLAKLEAHDKGRPGTYGEAATIEGIPVLRIPMKTTDVFSVLRASKQLQSSQRRPTSSTQWRFHHCSRWRPGDPRPVGFTPSTGRASPLHRHFPTSGRPRCLA